MKRLDILAAIFALMTLLACKPQPVQPAETAPVVSHPAITVTDELRPQLVFADGADGKTDHVVQKCVTCSLHMSGKPKFAVAVGDYRVQLCSEDCRTAFEKAPAKALLALEKP